MARRSRIHTVLTEILVTALATSTAIACGGTTADGIDRPSGDPGPGRETGESFCSNTTIRSYPYNLRPAVPVDYLEVRTETAFVDDGDASDGFHRSHEILSGSACAGASDKKKCQEALDDLRVLPTDRKACFSSFASMGLGCRAMYLLYTRGDEVRAVVRPEETLAFLAPIDTPEEALWALRALGRIEYACTNNDSASTIRPVEGGGYEIVFQKNCDSTPSVRTVIVGPDGRVTETKVVPVPKDQAAPCSAAGRRPEGFCPAALLEGEALGRYFASMAELEAVSVVAFRRLHRELAQLGAPKKLLRRLRSAARDEIRHARTTRDLARRFGGSIAKPCVAPAKAQRSAFEIALENAREGCVRETFGALLASHQALRAEDPVVREAMRAIADEETDHAALSWDLARWLDRRLSDDQRQAVRAAREEAYRELGTEVARPIDPRIARVAGLPSVELSTALLGESMRQLLAA